VAAKSLTGISPWQGSKGSAQAGVAWLFEPTGLMGIFQRNLLSAMFRYTSM
jgi:hypothetical protein